MRSPLGDRSWTAAAPWALASLPFVFMVAWFWNRGPGLDADDWAQALMHAQALYEGRPYGDIGYIGTRLDIAPPRQPPGLPAILATTYAVTGGFHWTTAKLTMALMAFPFFLLAGIALAREHGRAIGMAVMAMLTVGLVVRPPAGATHIQTDLGFAALIWSVLVLLDRPGKMSWPSVAAIFALASMAMAYRYLGAALVPTIALYAFLHRERVGRRLLLPLTLWGLGGIAVVALVGPDFLTTQVSTDVTWLWRGIRPLVNTYSEPAVASHLYPLPGNLPNDVFHVASLTLAVVGLVAWSRRSWRSAPWLFTAIYLLTLQMAFNRSGRYLIPLFPILIVGFLHGIRIALSAARAAWTERVAPLAAACTGAAVAASALVILLATEPRAGGYLHEFRDADEMFSFLSSSADRENVRAAFVQPRVLAWRTGVPAMVLPNAEPEAILTEFERLGITHVVIDQLGLQPRRTERALGTIAAHACRFEMVFQNASFQVQRFLPVCREA
jgi:hypothetical protein